MLFDVQRMRFTSVVSRAPVRQFSTSDFPGSAKDLQTVNRTGVLMVDNVQKRAWLWAPLFSGTLKKVSVNTLLTSCTLLLWLIHMCRHWLSTCTWQSHSEFIRLWHNGVTCIAAIRPRVFTKLEKHLASQFPDDENYTIFIVLCLRYMFLTLSSSANFQPIRMFVYHQGD